MIALGFVTLAIVIGLIGAVVFGVYKLGFLGRFWDALYPDFASFNIGRGTTQTFRMLVVAMLVFGIVLALWAAGAGVMRTAWLYTAGPGGVAQGLDLKGEACAAADCGNAGFLYLFSLLQVLRAAGGVLLICLTSGLVGAFLGFVFGLPRPMTAPEAPPAAAGGPGTPPVMDRRQASRAWELSTNLTQISDWLTKIIVGVSLVEATNIWKEFQVISSQAAAALFDGRHGSPALIPAAMIGGAVFGFLFAYLYTELIVALLIAGADRGLAEPTPPAKETLQKIQSFHEGLAPRISRSARLPEAPPSATREEVAAALQFNTIQYDDLISRPDVGRDDILNWSRAKAVLNDYRAAAQGYTHLLGMQGS
ncbi:MAG: hypothetical protein JOZ11_03145 [Alphaproteobacteria bacterium]|nr:hypothetical protein [Alphaproteobacteria bacterium]